MGKIDRARGDLRDQRNSSTGARHDACEEGGWGITIKDRPRFAPWQLFLTGLAASTGLMEFAKRWKRLRANEIEEAYAGYIRHDIERRVDR